MGEDFGSLLGVDCRNVAGSVESLTNSWVLAIEVVKGDVSVAEGGRRDEVDV